MKNRLQKLRYLSAVPRSFMFCIKTLPIREAIKLPILIGSHVKIFGCNKGCIIFSEKPNTASVRIGLWDGAGRNGYKKTTIINVDKDASIIFGKNVVIAKDSKIRVIRGGGNSCLEMNLRVIMV